MADCYKRSVKANSLRSSLPCRAPASTDAVLIAAWLWKSAPRMSSPQPGSRRRAQLHSFASARVAVAATAADSSGVNVKNSTWRGLGGCNELR